MNKSLISYQLILEITREVEISVGKLGIFVLPKGIYIYTGSAKKNIDKRIERHLIKTKKLHWHIDYLLNNLHCHIQSVQKSNIPECILNQRVSGKTIIPGFGSSDCINGCTSHLKQIENL